jgi:IS1 family transposase
MVSMNQLSTQERARVVAALVEGNSIRSAVRLTGIAKNTVAKLLVDLGAVCSKYQDETIRGLKSRRVQCDEIWAYVGAKTKNATDEQKAHGWGDCWTWTAIDADSKVILSFLVGQRGPYNCYEFMKDVASRLANPVQLTTDGLTWYIDAVDHAFGIDIDYAMIQKHYSGGTADKTAASRYSPAKFTAATKEVIRGNPNPKHISTSFVERQNLTMRMSMRRFTRLTNGFSKKVENHAAMVALYFMYYNFARVHQTLRVTPAMEAGIADHVWSIEEIVALLG